MNPRDSKKIRRAPDKRTPRHDPKKIRRALQKNLREAKGIDSFADYGR